MRKLSKRLGYLAPVAGVACVIGMASGAGAALSAATYAGNGASGFGGTLGNGSLSLTDDGVGNLTATFNPSGGFTGNDVVVYVDSITGGFADTSTFNDDGDGGRESISANNSGNPSRELITFPTGFTADYALEFENTIYTGLFGLVSGGNNSLNYITGATPSGGTYSVTFPLSDIGLNDTPGRSFKFVADYISTSGYGSNETIGTSTTVPDTGAAPNAGFNGSIAFSSADTYTVPEPASLAVICVGGLMFTSRRRSRIA